MKLHLWRVFGITLLIMVFVLMLITNTRYLTTTYAFVDPSPNAAFGVAVMIIAAMILSLMFPQYHAARWSFLALATSSVLSVGINAAPRLGLVSASSMEWEVTALAAILLPFLVIPWLTWVHFTATISRPILALLPPPSNTKTKSESDQNQNRNRNPKLLGESDRKSATMPRITISRLRAKPKPKPTLSEAETNSESDNETKTNIGIDRYFVLETLRREGKVAAAARTLKISPTMVNNHIASIYEEDPRRVEEAVPDWVERRKGS